MVPFSCYFISATAFTSSSLAFIASASSLATPSLTGFGAPSTNSLASFNPRPVISLTAFITFIFSGPASLRITSNSVFSSAAATGAAPPAATGAAALTPNSSSHAGAFYVPARSSFPERTFPAGLSLFLTLPDSKIHWTSFSFIY